MADQAEILRKRREARQKKILASGESRLSKITGTAGTTAQVAPSPAVLLAREQLLKKEQEEERLKALQTSASPTSANATDIAATALAPALAGDVANAKNILDESNELAGGAGDYGAAASSPSSPTQRMARQLSASSTTSTAAPGSKTPTVQDLHDADPDDSLGAPPVSRHTAFASSTSAPGSPFGEQNPFFNNPFYSPQQQQALTKMMSEEHAHSSSNAAAKQAGGFGTGVPPGFTPIIPQADTTARWWKLLHLVLSFLLGIGVVYREYRRQGDLERFDGLATDKPLPYGVYQVEPIPVFWYFVTMELILQSSRMFLHGITASPSSTLATIAGFLPEPFADAIRVFMRYRLIWSSLVQDLSVVVFIVGVTIVFTHMFS
ncbi:hypothetical protein BG011_007785 [Mortierella polycephala]|uniref:Golgi to ER traffic protein 2 n=1 Tax=Mortierella polycephala TaxID=41804 RepID=A0A9P6PRK0_9FUNG|nr:hypothetical protein BG011_007785 [Mortierella polycephala]